jgi:hypothetical protein
VVTQLMRNADASINPGLWATFRTSTMGDAKIHAVVRERSDPSLHRISGQRVSQ